MMNKMRFQNSSTTVADVAAAVPFGDDITVRYGGGVVHVATVRACPEQNLEEIKNILA